MLVAAAFVPSAPLLVPQLTGGAEDPDAAAVRQATLAVGAHLAERTDHWVILGAASRSSAPPRTSLRTGAGTFGGYGSDVVVTLNPGVDASAPEPSWPLAALIGGWIRGMVAPGIPATMDLTDPGAPPRECIDHGLSLGRLFGETAERVGLLVIADGSNMLTEKAPGGYRPDAAAWQDHVDMAICHGNPHAGAEVVGWTAAEADERGISGRAIYQTALAAVSVQSWMVESRYAAAPFGVGYSVSGWWAAPDAVPA